jgi:bacteriocin-like protein
MPIHGRELTNQANELTADELEQVSGGRPTSKGANQGEYLVITMKDVIVSSVQPSSVL